MSQQTLPPQASLLGIPRELRDQILALVVASQRSAPKDASTGDKNRKQLWDTGTLSTRFGGMGVKYERYPPANRTELIPTLLVNHQLHEEALTAITLIPQKNSCHLDVSLVDENELWPTWLSVIQYTNRIDTVHVTIRVDGPCKDPEYTLRSGFHTGCGGPPTITWTFYTFLVDFLRNGPSVHDKLVRAGDREPKDGDFSVRNLNLNFVTPDTSKYTIKPNGAYPIKRWHPGWDEEFEASHANSVIGPDSLLKFILDNIGYLLQMDYHSAEYGGILYERIGKIQLLVDGVLEKEINLGKRLQELRFQSVHAHFGKFPRGKRAAVFAKWKAGALKERAMKRLDTIPSKEDKLIQHKFEQANLPLTIRLQQLRMVEQSRRSRIPFLHRPVSPPKTHKTEAKSHVSRTQLPTRI